MMESSAEMSNVVTGQKTVLNSAEESLLLVKSSPIMCRLKNRSGIRRNARPQFRAFLRDRTAHGAPLHFPLVVHDHAGAVLEVNEHALLSPEALALSDDDRGHDLLAQLRLALLDGAHDHVPRARLGQAVEAAADVADGDDVEVFGARVVRAVDDRGDRQTRRHAVLDAGGVLTSAGSFLSHDDDIEQIEKNYGRDSNVMWREDEFIERTPKETHGHELLLV